MLLLQKKTRRDRLKSHISSIHGRHVKYREAIQGCDLDKFTLAVGKHGRPSTSSSSRPMCTAATASAENVIPCEDDVLMVSYTVFIFF